jgi:hypothetical protein
MKVNKLLILILTLIYTFSHIKSSESNSNSNSELEFKLKALVHENNKLKEDLQKEKLKSELLTEHLTKECHKGNLDKKRKELKRLFSSFSELQSSSTLTSKTDPVFKSIVNFALPRETSYIGTPGERSNRMFNHLKLCPPGCVVGGTGS